MSRWIQHPITFELIPRDEYVRPKELSHYVLGEIEPFISPVDRTVIGSRAQLRAHNIRNNVTNAADYSPEYLAKKRHEHTFDKNASLERKKIMYERWTQLENKG